MSAPHRASAAAEGIDLALVGVILACAGVAVLGVRNAIRRHRPRRWPRSWTRDFRTEARERDEGRQS